MNSFHTGGLCYKLKFMYPRPPLPTNNRNSIFRKFCSEWPIFQNPEVFWRFWHLDHSTENISLPTLLHPHTWCGWRKPFGNSTPFNSNHKSVASRINSLHCKLKDIKCRGANGRIGLFVYDDCFARNLSYWLPRSNNWFSYSSITGLGVLHFDALSEPQFVYVYVRSTIGILGRSPPVPPTLPIPHTHAHINEHANSRRSLPALGGPNDQCYNLHTYVHVGRNFHRVDTAIISL